LTVADDSGLILFVGFDLQNVVSIVFPVSVIDSRTIEAAKAFLSTVKLPFYAGLGAFMLYILNRIQGKQPFSLFRALNIDVLTAAARPITIFADMILSSALGAAVVLPIAAPTTIAQAIIAGLGMTGILAAHTKQTE
jgi:hypothetical protein